MADGWYHSPDGRTRCGPLSAAQLRQLAACGELRPAHYVLAPGRRRWTRANTIRDLFPVLEVLPADPRTGPSPGAVAVRRFLSRAADVLGVLVFVAFLFAVATNLPGVLTGDPLRTRDGALARGYIRYAPLFHPEGKLFLEPWDRQIQRTDQDRLSRLFPDPAERGQAIDWGRRLVEAWRGNYVRTFAELNRTAPTIDRRRDAFRELCELPIDETFAAHAAWRRLICSPGASEAELFRIREVVTRAVPDADRHTTLLAWAAKRRTQRDLPVIDFAADLPTSPLDPSAPDTDWFRHWVLYDDLAVTDEVFLARRADVLALFRGERKFGRDAWRMTLDLGREAARARPDLADMGLSADDERVSLLALRDRLAGTDERAELLRRAELPRALRQSTTPVWAVRVLVGGLFAALCPNDEVLKFSAGRGWGAFSRSASFPGLRDPALRGPDDDAFRDVPGAWIFLISPTLIFFVGIGWLAYRGMRVVVLRGLGRLLGLSGDPRYLAFRGELERPRWALQTAALLVLLTFAVELIFADPFFLLYYEGPGEALLCVALSAMLGGLLVETIVHVCTLLLLRFGFDPEKTWLDEILAVLLATPLLLLFRNPWHLVICAQLIGLAPSAFHKLLAHAGLRTRHSRVWLPGWSVVSGLYERRPVSVLLTVCGLFVCSFCCLGCGVTLAGMDANAKPNSRSLVAAATHRLTAVGLAGECLRDPEGVQGRYAEQRVLVSGLARGGGLCPAADHAIGLETETPGVVVRCHFLSGAASQARRWHGGDRAVVGRFAGMHTEGAFRVVRLDDCVLAEDAGGR
jgi:hypothetical protein